jgi:4-amino-4-deoxy-L-arabinose transferase-like glycosyltransferase
MLPTGIASSDVLKCGDPKPYSFAFLFKGLKHQEKKDIILRRMNEQAITGGGRKGQWPFLALILILAIVPRTIHLSADPPARISPNSCGDYGDPASYAANARNKVLFGHTKVDDFNGMYASPVGHLATYLVFLVFGPGMWQMNLQPVLFSALLFGLFFFFARTHFPDARWLFFLLLTLNYPFIIYGRISDQIMPMTLFAVLGLFFFLKAWEKPLYFFPSALSLGFSFMAKGKIIYFLLLVVPLTGLIVLILRREAASLSLNVKRLGYFCAGALTVFLPWLFLVYLPGRDLLQDFAGLNAIAMFPRSSANLIQSWLLKPSFTFYGTNRLFSLLLFLYFFSLLLLVFNKKGRRPILPLEIACSLWFIIGVAVNSVIGYRPTRHYIEMTIPMVVLASLLLKRTLPGVRAEFEPKLRPLFYSVLFILLWVAVTSFSSDLFTGLEIIDHPYRCILILTGLTGVVFAAAVVLIERLLIKKGISIPRRLAVPVIAVALSVYAFQNILEYSGWINNATYNLKLISRDLGKAFPDSVFCGLEAPAISMENRNRAHVWYPNFANSRIPDFLNAMKVKYLFLADFNKEAYPYWLTFPDVMKRARFRVRYRLWRSWFDLFEIEDAPVPEEVDTGLYEAEKLERDVGLPLFNPSASNQFAVWVDSAKEGVVLQRKLAIKPEQIVEGRLFVRPEKAIREGPLLLIQLNIGKGIHYRRFVNIYDPEAEVGLGFLAVPFKIALPNTRELVYNLKVLALGNYSFALDRIEIRIRGIKKLTKPLP